jgi:hypothetical protein
LIHLDKSRHSSGTAKPSSFWPNQPHSACRVDNFSVSDAVGYAWSAVFGRNLTVPRSTSPRDSHPTPTPRALDRDLACLSLLPLDHRDGLMARLDTTGGSDPLPPVLVAVRLLPNSRTGLVSVTTLRGWFLTKCQPKDHDHHMKIGLLSALRCADARCLPGQPRNCAAPSAQPFTFGRPRSRHRASVRRGHCKHHRLHCS